MAALRIAQKDIRQRLRDRSFYLWGIAAPLGLAAIFSLLFGGITGGSLEVKFAVSDQDGRQVGRDFVSQLHGIGLFEVVDEPSAEAARQMAESGEVDAALIIPGGLTEAVTSSAGGAVVEVWANVDSPIAGQVARSVAEQFVGEVNAARVAVTTYFALAGRLPEPGEAEALGAAAKEAPTPTPRNCRAGPSTPPPWRSSSSS
jgi:ABC-2 type transport system permease protein